MGQGAYMSRGVAFPRPPLALHALPEACAALTHSHSLTCSWKRVSIPGLGELCNNNTARGEDHPQHRKLTPISIIIFPVSIFFILPEGELENYPRHTWVEPKVNQIVFWRPTTPSVTCQFKTTIYNLTSSH